MRKARPTVKTAGKGFFLLDFCCSVLPTLCSLAFYNVVLGLVTRRNQVTPATWTFIVWSREDRRLPRLLFCTHISVMEKKSVDGRICVLGDRSSVR